MDSYTSSTGISHLNKSEPTEALIFGDNTCPNCGNILELEKKWLNGIQINVRYRCLQCGYVCPIKHNQEDMEKLSPTYDKSVYDFLSNFGKDIHDRIADTLNRSV